MLRLRVIGYGSRQAPAVCEVGAVVLATGGDLARWQPATAGELSRALGRDLTGTEEEEVAEVGFVNSELCAVAATCIATSGPFTHWCTNFMSPDFHTAAWLAHNRCCCVITTCTCTSALLPAANSLSKKTSCVTYCVCCCALLAQVGVVFNASTLMDGPEADASLAKWSGKLVGRGAWVNTGPCTVTNLPKGFLNS